jgi:signal transduction histidine kinase
VPERRGGFKKQATVLNETLKSAVGQVRKLARGLAPVALNDESLGEALQQLTEEMTALYGVSCEFMDSTAARSESLALPGDSKSKGGATSPTEPTQQKPLKPNSITSLDRKTKEQLYLIAREAVNNAARHAQAKHVRVQLTGNETEWTLRIEDDGKGLPQSQPSGLRPQPSSFVPGMGIRIMRHRARLIGAGFTISSAPDEGTCVTVKNV